MGAVSRLFGFFGFSHNITDQMLQAVDIRSDPHEPTQRLLDMGEDWELLYPGQSQITDWPAVAAQAANDSAKPHNSCSTPG